MSDREDLDEKFEKGNIFERLEIVELIEKSGDIEGARSRYEWLATNCESTDGAYEAARLAYERSDYNVIPMWLHTAVGNGGDSEYFWDELMRLARSSDPAVRSKAKTAIRVAAAQDEPVAMIGLALLAMDQGRQDTARHWYSAALKAEAEEHPELDEFCGGDLAEPEALDGENWAEDLLDDNDE